MSHRSHHRSSAQARTSYRSGSREKLYSNGARARPRNRWTRASAAAAVCLALLGLTAAPASAGESADEWRGNGSLVEATFSRPPVGGTDEYLTDHLRGLIERAPAGASIKIALHSISGPGFKDALVNAQKRGVAVEVTFDGTKLGEVSIALRDQLRSAGGRFVECTRQPGLPFADRSSGGCLSPRTDYSKAHAKYALISATDKASGTAGLGRRTNVVWMSSANITNASGWGAYNNAVTVYDDAELYNGMVGLFNVARAQSWGSIDFYGNHPSSYVHGTSSNVSTWASPEQDSDLVLARLNQITPNSDCRVRVMQAQFSGDRGVEIAQKVVSLARAGCWTWVVVDSINGVASLGDRVKATLCGNVAVRSFPEVHDKAIMVNGIYTGSMKKVMFTGSHNITDHALGNNDEVLARVGASSGPLYDGYYRHFNSAYNNGAAVC